MLFGLLVVIACGVAVFFKLNIKSKPAPRQHGVPRQSSNPPNSTTRAPAPFDDDDNAEGDKWVAWRHKVGTFPRPAGKVVLPGMSKVILKATSARVAELKPFIEVMRSDRPSFTSRLEREPSNVYDANAIRIWGTGSRGGEVDLGYVPAEAAKVIPSTYSDDMPIFVEMVSCGYTVSQDSAYVKVRLLGPGAAGRKKFSKNLAPGT